MDFDPNTLEPDEIREIPVDRSKPLNGLTEEQTRILGLDPESVEQSRLDQNAWAAAKSLEEDAALVLATQEAVDAGEITAAEGALGLSGFGHARAHDLFVQDWSAAEDADAAAEVAWYASELDSKDYLAQHSARELAERAQLEQEREEAARELNKAQVESLQSQLDDFVASTPGAFGAKPEIEQRIINRVKATGSLPTTAAERTALISSVLNEAVALNTATEEMRSQVEVEWRMHRKAEGARSPLMTVADIANAEQHFKRERFNQLAGETQIDVASFEPTPSAEEQSAALTEKYRANEEKSTEFHRQVERLKEPSKSNDRGEGITDEKRRYKEAMARAEESGTYGQVNSAHGTDAVLVGSTLRNPGRPDIPNEWPDELGPAI